MNTYKIDIVSIIMLIEGKLDAKKYFDSLDLKKFWNDRKNGKSTLYDFEKPIAYHFNYDKMQMLKQYCLQGLFTNLEMIFLLEAISMLDDIWDIEDNILADILTLIHTLETNVKK